MMIKVFMLCSGLGHTQRGYESFFRECFDVLSNDASLDITLFKGGGNPKNKEIPLWNIPYYTWLAVQLGKLTRRGSYGPFVVEQFSFFLNLLPHLQYSQPNVIYFSEDYLGTWLNRWRRLTQQKYKLLLRNGGGTSPPYHHLDGVQHLNPTQFQRALDYGEPIQKQRLLPSGFHIPVDLQILTTSERESLRRKLGLPENQPLVLSVAAINSYHKRMNYIIQEVAALPKPRPYLLLLGQQDSESAEILELGNKCLGVDNFQIRTVLRSQVDDYYKIADIFALASLREGLPRVLVEAMSYGLPCLVHDYEITRYVLGDQGYFSNLQLAGNLANLISQVLAQGYDCSRRCHQHRSVYERFSWKQLHPKYVDMIQSFALGF